MSPSADAAGPASSASAPPLTPSSRRSSTTSSRTPSFPSGYALPSPPALPRLRLATRRLTWLACRWDRSGPAAATAAPPIGSRSPSPSASTTSTVTHPRSKRSNGTRVWNCSSDSATAGDFVYNALSPKVAPDVVFGPEDERFQPLVDYDVAGNGDKSCLARWDCRAPEGLLALVQELRELYIEYQKKRVHMVDDARVAFELSTVLSKEGIEVCMVPSADRPDEVKFAVPLLDSDLDIAKLVPGCPWRLPQKIHLQVIFPISRSSSYSSMPSAPRLKLISTPDLKSLLSVEDVKLPPWSNGMRATILSISGIFTFLVHFAIPLQFPKQQPVLTLQSSQHCNADGTPIMSPPINDYPWSPRWDQADMVERIYDFLTDECQNFKKFCSDAITQQK
ncbi:unnamed protein product [Miscanthus lutarioriparius]|uniref:BRISC and BRCA1-A complex member 2 n=1 Tax=Miscanthus lutarioriparius TaxID=422564 RepID=A0A811RZC0_9POAL|nr:unnamed protein product [Miscanthus lutarioriparius]